MEAASPLLGLGRDLNLWNSSCVNNCSGHGECSNGVCVCEVSRTVVGREQLTLLNQRQRANLISMSSVFIYLNLSSNCTHTLWEPLLYISRGTWQQHFNQSDMCTVEVQQKYLYSNYCTNILHVYITVHSLFLFSIYQYWICYMELALQCVASSSDSWKFFFRFLL